MLKNEYKLLTKSFEGYRLKPYKCPSGKITIGYGRNLTDCGISADEAESMFEKDFTKAYADAASLFEFLDRKDLDKSPDKYFFELPENVRYVLTDMVFNMGVGKVQTFKKFLSALKKGLYEDAAKEMLDSKWATQVGYRAVKLSKILLDKPE